MRKYDVAIIGAGPSGIFCARKLKQNGKKVVIFEKTGHVGGRLAVKKLAGHVFSIGVNSFQSTIEELNEMVEDGIQDDVLIRDGIEISGRDSIDKYIQVLTEGLEIFCNHKAQRITPQENQIVLDFKDRESVAAKDVILSIPAPQAGEILKNSGLELPRLDKVRYSSAIYYMAALDRELADPKDFKILQHVKKDKDYYLLAFQKDWSDKSAEILREEFDLVFKPVESAVKKWKYAKALKPISSDCQLALKDKNIYLVGDYFFGDQMDSATLSSQVILEDAFHIH